LLLLVAAVVVLVLVAVAVPAVFQKQLVQLHLVHHILLQLVVEAVEVFILLLLSLLRVQVLL
jgi:hypothetical protein